MRLDDACYMVVRCQYDVVNFFLLLREPAVDGVGARVVRAVAVHGLAACVAQQQPPLLQYAVGVEVVERLAVLRDDRGERQARTAGFGDALDGARDLALDHSRTAHLHSQRVHLVAYQERAFHRLDLLGALLLAHFGHGEHQFDRLVVVQQFGLDAEQR